jgi:outer membrane protein insertion porin family
LKVAFILDNSTDLVADGFYNRADLDTGFKNLVTDLHNQGFLRARVQSSRVEYNDKKDHVTVYLMLDEGPQTQIRALDFTGNKFFSSFELAGVTGLRTNTPLHLNNFEDSLAKLKTFYQNQGFLEMKLLNESQDIIHYNKEGTQARINFQIYEGPRIRVNSITVEGNSLTKTSVILREADFRLGEVLTPQKLDDATARLNKMGLFMRADIRTLEENSNVADRTLIISVTERDPGTFGFGGGVTSERNFTVRAFTSASYNNLWGTARGITGRVELRENVAEVRYPENEVTAGYLEPFLFNTRTRGRVNLTRSEYVYDYETSLDSLYYTSADKLDSRPFTEITIKNRVDLLLERDLTRHTKLTYKLWSLEERQDFDRYGRCLPDINANQSDTTSAYYFHPAQKCPPTVMQVAMIGPTLDLDYRDNPFLPTRGWFNRLSVGYSDPILASSAGVQFIKTDADFRVYRSLGSPRWVWANMVRGGYERNLSQDVNSGIPSDYSYVLGGIYTLRGYDYTSANERLPRDGDGGYHLGQTNTKLISRDSYYYLVKTEVRFPLYQDFGGVIFYDGGAVQVSGFQFSRLYQDAVGFGFRYNTPVGPVAVDFAFKLHPQPANALIGEGNAQSPFRFYFSIGTF